MVSFKIAFPDALSTGGVLSDVAQQMAMAGKAFLVSAGLFTTDMDTAIGPEVDTAEDYNLIAETIRKNRDAVFEKATTLAEDASTSDIMMMQATFGILNPEAYGPYMDDYLTESGFASMDAETLESVISLIGRFVAGSAGPMPETREEPPAPGQEEYADYFIANVVSKDYPVYVREVWEASRAEGVSVSKAIESHIENYREEYKARFEEANGRPMSGRQLFEFDRDIITEYRNRIAEQMNDISQLEINLRQVPNIEVTPRDIAEGYALGVVMQQDNFMPQTREVYREMLLSDDDFDIVFDRLNLRFTPSMREYGSVDTNALREQMRNQIDSVQEIVEQAVIYEGTRITPEDAMRYMGNAWANRDDLPNSPEHYLQFMEERIAHYQSNAGGNFDTQTASVRAAVDARNQVDLDSGVPEGAVNDPYLYPHQVSLFEDSIRRDMLVDKGHGLTEGQKQDYRSFAANPDRAENITELDYLTDRTGNIYQIGRDQALRVATELKYERAHADMQKNKATEPNLEEESAAPALEDGVYEIQATLEESYYNFMADLPESMTPDLIELNQAVVSLKDESSAAFDQGNFEAFLESSYQLTTLLAEYTTDPAQAQDYEEQAGTIKEFANRAGVDVAVEEKEATAPAATKPEIEATDPVLPREPEAPLQFGNN